MAVSSQASSEIGSASSRSFPAARLARAGLLLAGASALAAVSSGLGYRLGLWHFRTGFTILRFAAYGGALAALASLVAAGVAWPGRSDRRTGAVAVLGFVVGTLTVLLPWSQWRAVQHLPMIHDISTDTTEPPAFVALLELRRQAPNGADYEGRAVAEQQRAAYPDIVPLHLSMAPDKAFERTLSVVRELGWSVAAADPVSGRIEATETSLLFGFADDIVVRVRADGDGSRIDVRSMSRVGRSDVGANARRIRRLFARLNA